MAMTTSNSINVKPWRLSIIHLFYSTAHAIADIITWCIPVSRKTRLLAVSGGEAGFLWEKSVFALKKGLAWFDILRILLRYCAGVAQW